MLHHFFEHHGLGEKTVHLHADNCGGQNKNAIMVQYLLWRVMTNQHTEVTLSFMIPGHTKFSPDWCFGLLKKYRWTKVGGLSDLCGVVNDSAAVNIAQPTGLEDGSVVVHTYDWQEYFSRFFTKVKGIKKLHHIRFSSSSPGCIFVKEGAGSAEVKRCILKDKSWEPKADELPPVLSPTGLSQQRQWYLYEKIREFALIARRIPHAHGLVDHCKTPLPSIPHQQHLPDHHLLVVIPPPLLPLPPASMSHQRPSGQDCVDTAGSQGIMLALALINNFFLFVFVALIHHTLVYFMHLPTHSVYPVPLCFSPHTASSRSLNQGGNGSEQKKSP